MSLLDTSKVVKMDKREAARALQEYHAAKSPRTKEDEAIMTAYREIGRGKTVISVDESIRSAGWTVNGLPVLAMTRADVKRVECRMSSNEIVFSDGNGLRYARGRYRVGCNGMVERPTQQRPWRGFAIVPLIPLPLRPKFALRNYWILFEADWDRVPADPLLLRKLSGDLWLVLAAWELSAVEQAVLARRINA